ncbi:MAG: response regulator [Ignavibacteria bacterium]
MNKVLLVEDDLLTAKSIELILREYGFEVLAILKNADNIVEHVTSLKPDIILMDIILQGKIDGVTATENLRKVVDIPVIFITGSSDRPTLDRIKSVTNSELLPKPFSSNNLLKKINTIFGDLLNDDES